MARQEVLDEVQCKIFPKKFLVFVTKTAVLWDHRDDEKADAGDRTRRGYLQGKQPQTLYYIFPPSKDITL